MSAGIAPAEGPMDVFQLADVLPDGVWVGSADLSQISYVNDAFERIWGRSRAELCSSSIWFEGVHPDDRAAVVAVVGEHPSDGWGVACRVVHPDGSVRHVEVQGFAPTAGADDEMRRFGLCRDVTDQIDADRLLRSERLLDRMSRLASIGAWEMEIETQKGFYSDGLFEVFGLEVTDAASTWPAVLGLCHPDDRSALLAAAEKAENAGQPYDLTVRIVTPDGTRKWVRGLCEPVVVDGLVTRLLGSVQDVTADVEAAKALARAQEMLDHISRLALIGGWVLDPKTMDVEWADEIYRIFEVPEGEQPEYLESSTLFHPDDRHTILEAVKDAVDGGVPYDLQLRAITASGARKWVHTIGQPVVENGRTIRLWGSIQDITRIREMELTEREHAEGLRDAFAATIGAVVRTIESRDPYTAGHQERVAELSAAIAEELGLEPDVIRGVRFGASIHDLGKISVPAEILNRPGELGRVEFEMIKTHPQQGFDILAGVQFPWPVNEIVLQHHERLDGSGYPNGLIGSEIRFEALIVAVADVVEAMSSHRPYRPALGTEAALNEITLGRGVLYDPDVVDACLALFREHRFQFRAA